MLVWHQCPKCAHRWSEERKIPISRCVVDRGVYEAAMKFVAEREEEWGGIGIGSYEASGQVSVKAVIFPPQMKHDRSYCVFDSRYVALLRFRLDDLGLLVDTTTVAWVHTHPGHGIFLSSTDQETYQDLLTENTQLIALVIEPVGREIGGFKGIKPNQKIPVEISDCELTEMERVKLCILPKMLPEMVAVLVPTAPGRPSGDILMEVIDALIKVNSKLRRWAGDFGEGSGAG